MQTVAAAYAARIAKGELSADPAQKSAIADLDAVLAAVDAHHRSTRLPLAWITRRHKVAPRGLYLWGGVGRGKTMLMDLFFSIVPSRLPKRRCHFHEFMADVHDRIGQARKSSPGDPMPIVGRGIAREAQLLCFDELHVTDIADAMILGRLFDQLFAAGVTVVATSNVEPQRLYENGLNRDLFLPFVDLIERNLDVRELISDTDHRLRKLAGQRLYFSPLGVKADEAMDSLWTVIAGQPPHGPDRLEVAGREVIVPRQGNGAARFSFAQLCDAPLGSRDYLALARAYHTVFIDGIPILTTAQRNPARRLINLVDTLYDNRVSLVVSAAAEPDALYISGDGSDMFVRTASRLIEMRSAAYVADRMARLQTPNESSPAEDVPTT